MGCFAAAGALAGCESDDSDGNGGNGDPSGNGDDQSGNGNGQSGNGDGIKEWQPFRFTQAGTYVWTIDTEDGQFDELIMTVESVSGDTATVTAEVTIGGTTQEATASGTPDEIRNELSGSIAGSLLSITYFAPPLTQSEGERFSVDNEWTIQDGGDTAAMRVTGEDSIAGLSCKSWAYSLNEQVRMEGCVNVTQGLVLYFETYDDSGTSEFMMELIEYTPE